MVKLSDVTLGFLGAGNMAQAIGLGLIKSGTLKSPQIIVFAPSERCFSPWRAASIETTHCILSVFNKAQVVFLGMKPQMLDQFLLDAEREKAKPCKSILFVSLLVGTTLSTLEKKIESNFGKGHRIIRVMPNTPLMVGAGCSAVCHQLGKDSEDVALVKAVMSQNGTVSEIPESLISTFAALAGSGPAYGYIIIEALADGAVKNGMPRDMALQLAAQTMAGASKMVLETNTHPGQLKDQVCSPGGTTIAAIYALEKAGIRGGMMDAINAAVARSKEMS
ncbi:unnamed protein product [Bemisia tabaci]|uniref:Pyrroline-5-carboxylate reductase n=1 Tax=Bemisia tabaci TaxID=7038 RepID=A0A9P0ADS7_BEMTA|nr:unnamed protein product [Bemisia tabaci]